MTCPGIGPNKDCGDTDGDGNCHWQLCPGRVARSGGYNGPRYGKGPEEAHALAVDLAARLGAHWEPYTWDNLQLGWYFGAKLGELSVVPESSSATTTVYTARLSTPERAISTWSCTGETPSAAVENVLRMAQVEVDHRTETLAATRRLIGRSIRATQARADARQRLF